MGLGEGLSEVVVWLMMVQKSWTLYMNVIKSRVKFIKTSVNV